MRAASPPVKPPTRSGHRSPSPNRSPSRPRPRALCHDWDTEQVCAWLTRVVGLPQYARSFRQARIDGPGLLHLFTHERAGVAGPTSPPRAYHRHHHLHAFAAPSSMLERVLGVYDAGHKARLLEGIRRLKDGESAGPPLEPAQPQRPRGRMRRCGGCMPAAPESAAATRVAGVQRAPMAVRVPVEPRTRVSGSGASSQHRLLPPARSSSCRRKEEEEEEEGNEEEPSSLRKVRA
jgi:hypothetical protein